MDPARSTRPPAATPAVSVVVPVYNRAGLLPRVIEALLAQDVPAEVIIADDGSRDGSGKVAARYPVRVVRQENRGPAAARNLGARAAAAPVLAFTDSDCIAEPSWLRTLLEGFDGEGVGAVAGSYAIANPRSRLARLIHAEILERHARLGRTVRVFGSYNVAVRRELFEALGGFDESYRAASGEDNDLAYRILRRGLSIRFQPRALVAHHHTESLGKYLREQRRHGYWRMKMYHDHPGMSAGDDYTGAADILEPPLALLVLGGAWLLLTPLWAAEAAAIALLAALRVPAALRLAAAGRDPRLLLLAPLSTLRAFARGWGMLAGAWRFLVRGRG